MRSLPPEILSFAQRGMKLIVLDPNTKIPVYPRWQNENCSSDPKVLQHWFDNLLNPNVAVVCGCASEVVVIDIDVKHGQDGMAWYQQMCEEHGVEWAYTLRVRTPSGGLHLYFIWVEGIGKDNTGKLAPGVDIQGEISYVVIPPSVIDGQPYTFEMSDAETDVLPLPEWLAAQLYAIFAPKPQIETSRVAAPPANGEAASHGEGKIPSGLGQRHQFLLHHAGQLLHFGIGFKALNTQLQEVNLSKFQEPYPADEITRQAQDFFNRWRQDPADLFREFRRGASPPKANGEATKLEARLMGRWVSDIQERDVMWLREPDVPLGALTLLSGDPGAGKTWLALELGKRVTNEGGVVLYLTVENPAEEVLKPRFLSLGGDVTKLRIIDGVEFKNPETGNSEIRSVTLQDLVLLEHEIREIGPLLVVVDPIQSYLGAKVDAHRSNETRPVLDGLIRLAQKYRFAPFVLRHCAKNATGKALYRGLGSIDFTAAARSELLAVEMSPGKFACAHVKSNLGPKGPTREYSISAEKNGVLSKAGYFEWGSELNLSANDLIAEDRVDHRLEEAEDFLKEKLRDEAQLATDLIEEAKQAGISERTLKRAKKKLGIEAYKRVDRRWQWCMPKDAKNS